MNKRKTYLFDVKSPTWIAITVCLALFVTVIHGCKHSDETLPSDKKAKRERFQAGMRLDTLLCRRDLESALLLIDTLHTRYPCDPQFYFGEGWIYQMKNDSIKARSCFTKAVAIYDSLIAVKKDFGDEINRAVIIQILYGKEAYDKSLDEILRTAKSTHDSLVIEEIYRKLIYKKEDLFKPEMLRTFPDSITQRH